MEKSSADNVKKMAIAKGMRTLRQDGWLKVLKGITTIDNIICVNNTK